MWVVHKAVLAGIIIFTVYCAIEFRCGFSHSDYEQFDEIKQHLKIFLQSIFKHSSCHLQL